MSRTQTAAALEQVVKKNLKKQGGRTRAADQPAVARATTVPAAKLVDPQAWLRHAIDSYRPCKAHAKRAERRASARRRREKHLERYTRYQMRPRVKRPVPQATSESGHLAQLLNGMGERGERTLNAKQATKRQARERTLFTHEAAHERHGGGAVAGTGKKASKHKRG